MSCRHVPRFIILVWNFLFLNSMMRFVLYELSSLCTHKFYRLCFFILYYNIIFFVNPFMFKACICLLSSLFYFLVVGFEFSREFHCSLYDGIIFLKNYWVFSSCKNFTQNRSYSGWRKEFTLIKIERIWMSWKWFFHVRPLAFFCSVIKGHILLPLINIKLF